MSQPFGIFSRCFSSLALVFLSFLSLAGGVKAQVVATPEFSREMADGVTPFDVTVTCATSGATLRYTTDLSEPNSSSTLVPGDGKILIQRNLTLKVKGFKAGLTDSAVKSSTFRVTGAVSAGAAHVLALKSNGQLRAWGAQASGRLGNGGTAAANIITDAQGAPVLVTKTGGAAVQDVIDMAAGYATTLVVEGIVPIGGGGELVGAVWATGDNANGQLGDNTTTDQSRARRVLKTNVSYGSAISTDFLDNVVGVSIGYGFSTAVDSNGFVWAWGQKALGRLADGYTSATGSFSDSKFARKVRITNSPSDVYLTNITQVRAGQAFSLALRNEDPVTHRGELWGWGHNAYGQLSNGGTSTTGWAQVLKLNATDNLTDVVDFAAGWEHAVAIRKDNSGNTTVWTWGQQANGRLGNGQSTSDEVWYPYQVQVGGSAMTNIVQVAAAGRFTLALGSDGKVWSWGYNADGQLGDGSVTQRTTPVRVMKTSTEELTDVVYIAAGGHDVASPWPGYSIAITADGKVWGWGYNQHGETGNKSTTPANVYYATASTYSLRLSNQPPSVELTLGAGANLQVPGNFTLNAAVTEPDQDPISRVDFYRDGVYAGSDNVAPYSYNWTNGPVGTSAYTAIAYDVTGANASSAPLNITVGPVVSLTITDAAATEAVGHLSAGFKFTRSPVTSSPLVVTYTATGSAVNGSDYQLLSGTATIPANVADVTVPVTAFEDAEADHGDVLTVTIVPTAEYTYSGNISGNIYIYDPQVTIVATDGAASESGSNTGTFRLSLKVAGVLATRATVPVCAYYVMTGTASNGADYILPGYKEIPVGSTTSDIVVFPTNDLLVESQETATLTLSSGLGSYVTVVGSTVANVTINDRPQLVGIFAVETDILESPPVPGKFVVFRDGPVGSALSLGVVTGGTATSGSDYSAITTVTIPAGQTHVIVSVTPINDYSDEGDKTITVTLQPSGSDVYALSSPNSVSFRLLDDERKPSVSVSLVTTSIAEEGPSASGYTFTRTGTLLNPLTVIYTITGTATGMADYPALSGNVVFAAGASSVTVPLKPTDDSSEEGTETVVVTISSNAAYTIAGPGNASLSIVDNDPAVSTPTLSPPGGFFERAPLPVAVSCSTAGAVIRYTTDGSEPTASSTAIASGSSVTLTASHQLRVKAWKAGLNPSVSVLENYVLGGDVAAGEAHSLWLRADGTVWATGLNVYGQLGNGTTISTNSWTQVMASAGIPLTGVRDVAAGRHFSVILKDDGTVWTWGFNNRKQLGNGSTANSSYPVQVEVSAGVGLTNGIAVAAGAEFALVLKNDKSVMGWGNNGSGQLGNNTDIDQGRAVAMQFVGGAPTSDIVAIAAGHHHSVILKETTPGTRIGTAWTVGSNSNGQLGDGTTTSRKQAVEVKTASGGPPLTGVFSISAGEGHTLAAIQVAGVRSAWGWGDDLYGQLGNGAPTGDACYPTQVVMPGAIPLVEVDQVCAGANSSAAFTASGVVRVWGLNTQRELGNGSETSSVFALPSIIPSTIAWKRIAGGTSHFILLSEDLRIGVWGKNEDGQLGIREVVDVSDPVVLESQDDRDGDGLVDYTELLLGTNLDNAHSNNDGVNDLDSVRLGIDPRGFDFDNDGLSNADEMFLGSNLYWADTDGDGISDGVDAFPLDPNNSGLGSPNPSDTTPPVVTLIKPPGATLLP